MYVCMSPTVFRVIWYTWFTPAPTPRLPTSAGPPPPRPPAGNHVRVASRGRLLLLGHCSNAIAHVPELGPPSDASPILGPACRLPPTSATRLAANHSLCAELNDQSQPRRGATCMQCCSGRPRSVGRSAADSERPDRRRWGRVVCCRTSAPTDRPTGGEWWLVASRLVARRCGGGGGIARFEHRSDVSIRKTRATEGKQLELPRVRTEHARKFFNYRACALWNTLPADVSRTSSMCRKRCRKLTAAR